MTTMETAWEQLEYVAITAGVEIIWLTEYAQWMLELGNRQVFTGTDLASVIAEARRTLAS